MLFLIMVQNLPRMSYSFRRFPQGSAEFEKRVTLERVEVLNLGTCSVGHCFAWHVRVRIQAQ
jgi:hypothetical protein